MVGRPLLGSFIALFVSALAGCGEVTEASPDGGDAPQDGDESGDFSLAVAPDGVAIPFVEAKTVTVSVERTGATKGSPGQIPSFTQIPARVERV